MSNEWDQCFARDAVPLMDILPDWFPKSYQNLRGGFFSAMESELRALRARIDREGTLEQLLSNLAPEAVRRVIPDRKGQVEFARRAWEATILMDMPIRVMDGGMDTGKMLLAVGSLTFSRNHVLKMLADKNIPEIPVTNAVLGDLSEGRILEMQKAFGHGCVIVPGEGDHEFRWVSESGEQNSASVRMMNFVLRINLAASIQVYLFFVEGKS